MLTKVVNASVLLSLGLSFVACKSSSKGNVAGTEDKTRRPTVLAPNQQTQAMEASLNDELDAKKLYEMLQIEEKAGPSYFFKSFVSSDSVLSLKCLRNKLPVGIAYSCDINMVLSDDPKLKTKAEAVGTTLIATLDAADSAQVLLGAEAIDFVSHDNKLSIKCEGAKDVAQCKVSMRLK